MVEAGLAMLALAVAAIVMVLLAGHADGPGGAEVDDTDRAARAGEDIPGVRPLALSDL